MCVVSGMLLRQKLQTDDDDDEELESDPGD